MSGGSRAYRWNRSLHRDLGYALAVLTVLYAVSGLAVNHIDDWNPSYAIRKGSVDVGPLDAADLDAAEARIVAALALEGIGLDFVFGDRHRLAPRITGDCRRRSTIC